ncbi:unnamed protein product, partial [Pylaiella littoralis]
MNRRTPQQDTGNNKSSSLLNFKRGRRAMRLKNCETIPIAAKDEPSAPIHILDRSYRQKEQQQQQQQQRQQERQSSTTRGVIDSLQAEIDAVVQEQNEVASRLKLTGGAFKGLGDRFKSVIFGEIGEHETSGLRLYLEELRRREGLLHKEKLLLLLKNVPKQSNSQNRDMLEADMTTASTSDSDVATPSRRPRRTPSRKSAETPPKTHSGITVSKPPPKAP